MEITNQIMYDLHYRRVMRDASRINRRVERIVNAPLGEAFRYEDAQTFCDELNAQRKINSAGGVVAPAGKEDENGLR